MGIEPTSVKARLRFRKTGIQQASVYACRKRSTDVERRSVAASARRAGARTCRFTGIEPAVSTEGVEPSPVRVLSALPLPLGYIDLWNLVRDERIELSWACV